MANDQKIYLKQQNVRRGKAGYKNLPPNTEVVSDPTEARNADAVKRSHHKSKDNDE